MPKCVCEKFECHIPKVVVIATDEEKSSSVRQLVETQLKYGIDAIRNNVPDERVDSPILFT